MPQKSKKHWSEKSCDEMTYGEFVRWAQEYVIDGLLRDGGQGIKDSVEMIVSQAAINTEFGGRKKQ